MKFNWYRGGGTLLAVLFAALPAKADHTVISGNESKDTGEYIRESANGSDENGRGGAVYIDGGTLTFKSKGTFKNNTASGEGGAVYNSAGTLSVNNGVIYNNEGKAGGAIYNNGGTVEIKQKADFQQNAATDGDGGAIYNNLGQVTLDAAEFLFNTATNGNGGAIFSNSTVALHGRATFYDNSAKVGGAVYVEGDAGLQFFGDASFTYNKATQGNGGAIYGSLMSVNGEASFISNKAENGDGGAIYTDKTAIFNQSAEFTSNKAQNGGAIYNLGEISVYGYATFEKNEADQYGGAIYNAAAKDLYLKSGEFKNNTATNGRGGAIYNKGAIYFEGTSYTFEGNTDRYGASDIYNDERIRFCNTNADTSVTLDAVNGVGTVEISSGSSVSFASSSGSDMVLKNKFLVESGSTLQINGGAEFKNGELFTTDGLAMQNYGTVVLGKAGSQLKIDGAHARQNGAFYNLGDMTVNGDIYAVNNGAMSKGGLFYNDGTLTFNGSLLAESTGDIYNSADKVLTFAGSSYKFNIRAGTPVTNDGEMILGAAGKSTSFSLKNVAGSGTTLVNGNVSVSGLDGGAVSWENRITVASGATLDIGKSALEVGNALESTGTLKLTLSDLTADSSSFTGGAFKTTGTATISGTFSITLDPSVMLEEMQSTGELQLIKAGDYTGISFANVIASIGYEAEYVGDGKFVIRRLASPTPTPTPTPVSGQDQYYPSVYGVRAAAKSVRNTILARANGGFVQGGYKAKGKSGGDEADQYGLWAQGVAGDFHRKGAYNGDVYGFVAGFDGKVSDALTLGVGYGYTYTSESSDGVRTKTRMHNGFVYGRYQPSDWFADATAGYGFGDSEIKDGDSYDTQYADASVTLGRDFTTSIGVITPAASLRYTFVKTDDYTADGVSYASKDSDILTGAAGLRWSDAFGAFKPYVSAAATYDFISDGVKVTAVSGGVETVLRGDRTKRLGAEFGAGVSAEITDDVSVTADWRGNFTTHYRDNTASLAVRIDF